MITETGQERPGQEEKDPTAGKGQPRSEGEGVAQPGSDAGGAAAPQRARTSAPASGGRAPPRGRAATAARATPASMLPLPLPLPTPSRPSSSRRSPRASPW